MKTTKSGSGVKAANLHMVIRTIMRQKNRSSINEYAIKNQMSTAEISAAWDYKADGLTIDKAKKMIIKTFDDEKKIREERGKNRSYELTPGRILRLQEEKKRKVYDWIIRHSTLEHPYAAYCHSFGVYHNRQRAFALPMSCKYPVIITVKWDTECDWNYYAKSYKHPRIMVDSRRVEFSTLDKCGNEKIIYTHNLTGFRGNWMEDAIVAYVGLKKVKTNLKNLQLNDYISLKLIREIGGCRIYSRSIGQVMWGFAIDYNGVNYHAYNLPDLFSGYRYKVAQIKAKAEKARAVEEEKISYKEVQER